MTKVHDLKGLLVQLERMRPSHTGEMAPVDVGLEPRVKQEQKGRQNNPLQPIHTPYLHNGGD